MTLYGVQASGFVVKPLIDIFEALEADVLGTIDAALDTSPEEPLGQFLGIMADEFAANWELLGVLAGANDRDKSEAFLLDSLGTLIGVPRLPAAYSTVRPTLTLAAGTTITAGVAKINVIGYPTDIWIAAETFTAPSDGDYDILFRADTTGPRVANAHTLLTITVPISGFSDLDNASAADLGRLEEADAAYRARQLAELAQAGSSTVVAVRAALLAAFSTTSGFQAKVFENVTTSTDGLGLPPHSMRAVIWDGVSAPLASDDIAQVLWDNKGGGIAFTGALSGTAVDSEGNDRVIAFSRAGQQNVYLTFTVSADHTLSGPEIALVKAAVLAKGNAILKVGTDVVALTLRSEATTVTGVYDVPTFTLKIGSAPSGGDVANLVIAETDIALLSVAHMSVTQV